MTKRFATFNLLALMCFPVAARASLLFGTMNFTGDIELSLGDIAFADGKQFNIETSFGDFTALSGTNGLIQDITNPPDATGVLATPVTDFMTFSIAPNITITLTVLPAGIDGAADCADPTPAAGQECTPDVPAETPFNFQNTSATSSTLSFSVLGIEVDSSTNSSTPISGMFAAQFATDFQDVVAAYEGGTTAPFPFSADLNTIAPEPNTWMALAIGLAGIGWRYRRSLKKR